jgi:hypothetical protein
VLNVLLCLSRSIVLEIDTNNVVSVSPYKSDSLDSFTDIYNSDEKNKIVYEEFVDGTMINLFKYQNVYYISTRSCLGAQCRWFSSKSLNITLNDLLLNHRHCAPKQLLVEI